MLNFIERKLDDVRTKAELGAVRAKETHELNKKIREKEKAMKMKSAYNRNETNKAKKEEEAKKDEEITVTDTVINISDDYAIHIPMPSDFNLDKFNKAAHDLEKAFNAFEKVSKSEEFKNFISDTGMELENIIEKIALTYTDKDLEDTTSTDNN